MPERAFYVAGTQVLMHALLSSYTHCLLSEVRTARWEELCSGTVGEKGTILHVYIRTLHYFAA